MNIKNLKIILLPVIMKTQEPPHPKKKNVFKNK